MQMVSNNSPNSRPRDSNHHNGLLSPIWSVGVPRPWARLWVAGDICSYVAREAGTNLAMLTETLTGLIQRSILGKTID